jgi:hypothetical protein
LRSEARSFGLRSERWRARGRREWCREEANGTSETGRRPEPEGSRLSIVLAEMHWSQDRSPCDGEVEGSGRRGGGGQRMRPCRVRSVLVRPPLSAGEAVSLREHKGPSNC